MKVILTKDVPKLGKSGDEAGRRRLCDDFLIPQSLAVPAAGGAYRAWQHDIASREDKRVRERADAEIAATRIASTTLTMGVKVGEGGKLFGSITSKDIADALARRGIEIDRHKIDLEEPLKTLGTYKVAIKVFSGMTPEVTIVVEPKGCPPGRSGGRGPARRSASPGHPGCPATPTCGARQGPCPSRGFPRTPGHPVPAKR